jgi:NRAMP (natural resistance-associated macrophage protein)-like metal ion transporter
LFGASLPNLSAGAPTQQAAAPRPPRTPGRHLHWLLLRRRPHLLRRGTFVALFAVVGPGVLAGLSDDDPAGITTYSILGAKYGYELLWVLALSTAALIVFHELGARMGIVTGKGLMALVREHSGKGPARLALGALVLANTGTLCAEFAGISVAMQLLAGVSRYVSVPLAGLGVSLLVLRGSFRHVEHILLALSAVFISYILSGFLAHPDWGATAKGLVVPQMPLNREAVLVAVATVGTTLAPWGLAFIQSYAVDKQLHVKDLRYERIDVITGAVMTGVIGLFVVVACAATLHVQGITINDGGDAARALEPLAGHLASTLFGLGFLGAALLAAAIVPLSTAYSVAESVGRRCDINDSFQEARVFYCSYGVVLIVAAALVLIPGAPLIPILFLSQALNAVLLLVLLPFMRRLARDPAVMGDNALGPTGRVLTAVVFCLVAASVTALAVLSVI